MLNFFTIRKVRKATKQVVNELQRQTVAAAKDPNTNCDGYSKAVQMDYTLGYIISYATKCATQYLGEDAEKHADEVVFGAIRGLFTRAIGEQLLKLMEERATAPTVDFWDGYSTAAAEVDDQLLSGNDPAGLQTFLSSGGSIRISM